MVRRRKKNRRSRIALALALVIAACRAREPFPSPPSGAPYEIEIRGNRAFSRDDILDAVREDLEEFIQEDFAEVHLDDAAFDLERHYRKQGYPFVVVEHRIERTGSRTNGILDVSEGPRVTLEDVLLEGNEHLPSERLLSHFHRGGFLRSQPFDRLKFESEVESMLEEFRDEGFADAGVRVDYDYSRDLEEVTPRITIREGRRRVVSRIDFEGNDDLSEIRLRRATDPFLWGPYSRVRLFHVRVALLDLYLVRGHPFVQIAEIAREDPETGHVSIRIQIREGPRATVRDVVLKGNVRTESEILLHRLRIAPGDVFDQTDIRESRERLIATGLFESVRLDVVPVVPDPSQVDVITEVVERDPLFTDFRVGYGSYEKARFGVTVGTLNLAGTGKKLEGGVRVSTKNRRAEVTYTDPFVLSSDTEFQAKAFDERREEPSFSVDRIGGSLTLSRLLFESIRGSFGYSYINSNAFDLDPGIPEDEGPHIDTAGCKIGISRDARDNLTNPDRGTFVDFTHEISAFALGGDVNFYRGTITAAAFQALALDTVLGIGVRGGVITPFGATAEIPIQERFFNGGDSSVRSFKEGELGPRTAEGNPLGGEGALTGTVELRQAIYGPLQVAVFGDAGNVVTRAEDVLFSGYRYAIGTGVRFVTPVGPLRVDIALNPHPRSDEDTYVVHITVGYSF